MQPDAPFLPLLDRAAQLRKDGAYLEARLAEPETLLLPVWRNKLLVSRGPEPHPAPVRVTDAPGFVARDVELVWLGLLDGKACFAVDLSELDQPLTTEIAERSYFEDLRVAGSLMHPCRLRDPGVREGYPALAPAAAVLWPLRGADPRARRRPCPRVPPVRDQAFSAHRPGRDDPGDER